MQALQRANGKTKTTMLKCEQIVFEQLVYPRTLNVKGEPDWLTSYRYSRKMMVGEQFPPITVCKLASRYILVDGYYRLKAWRDHLKKKTVEVELIKCKDLDEIYIEALRRNRAHGEQLTPFEIAEAIRRLKAKGHSITDIGKILSMPTMDVKQMTEMKIRKGSQGEMAVKAVLQPIDVRGVSPEDQRLFASASQVQLLEEVVKIIENGWLDDTNKQVIILIEKLKDLLRRL